MLRLKRHIVTEIVEVFFAVIVALILIMVSFQFAKLLGQAASGKIVGSAVYKLVALQTINFFVLLTPFAFFIAVLVGLSKLASDNELVAMKSVGYSDLKIYQALFVIAIPLSILTLFLTLSILPKVLSLSYQLTEQAKKESQLSVIQPGNFRSIGTDLTIFVSDLDDSSFSKFFLWQRTDSGESITISQTGTQIEDENDSERYIELKNGFRYGESKDGSYIMDFVRFLVVLPAIQATSKSEHLKSLSTAALVEDTTLAKKVEFQRRIMPAISILILALFSPLLVDFNPRKNRYGKFVTAILVYFIYLNSQYILKSLIEGGKLPITPGIYTTHIVFLAIILFWMWLKFQNNRHTKPASG